MGVFKKKMKHLNYIFVGGKELGYGCLNYLLKKKLKPLYVVCNKDDNGRDNIFNRSLLRLSKKNRLKITKLKKLKKLLYKKKIKLDIIFCLGSTQILPIELISYPKMGVLNIHPSLLPKYRGRYSLVHAIFNGEKLTGITTHWLGKKIDSGRVISQKKIRISNQDTAETLYKKFTKVSLKEFKKIFKRILQNKKILSHRLKTQNLKYKNKNFPNNGEINWSWNGKKIYNFLRSMIHEPFPPPEIKIGNKAYYFVSKNLISSKKIINSPK